MKVEEGRIVRFHQTYITTGHGTWGRLEQEVKFPGSLSKAVADTLRGLSEGEQASVEIHTFKDMVRSDELIIRVPRHRLNSDVPLKPGMIFRSNPVSGARVFSGYISEIHDDYVLIDCNPPFIGKGPVKITVKVLKVREASQEESEKGFEPTSMPV